MTTVSRAKLQELYDNNNNIIIIISEKSYDNSNIIIILFQRKVECGDVIDELFGVCIRGWRKGKIMSLFKQHKGLPIPIKVIKVC